MILPPASRSGGPQLREVGVAAVIRSATCHRELVHDAGQRASTDAASEGTLCQPQNSVCGRRIVPPYPATVCSSMWPHGIGPLRLRIFFPTHPD